MWEVSKAGCDTCGHRANLLRLGAAKPRCDQCLDKKGDPVWQGEWKGGSLWYPKGSIPADNAVMVWDGQTRR